MQYAFTGGSADLVLYDGLFTVENNLLTDWSLTATSRWDPLPSFTFTNEPGQTATYCYGQCLFGSTETVTIFKMVSDTGFHMRLTFHPDIYQQASLYQQGMGAGARVTWGDLTTSVPEPATALFLVMALSCVALLKRFTTR